MIIMRKTMINVDKNRRLSSVTYDAHANPKEQISDMADYKINKNDTSKDNDPSEKMITPQKILICLMRNIRFIYPM